MVPFRQQLVVFGGCEGGEDQTAPFNDVWVLDLSTKVWALQKITGKKPAGRDGHAGGLIRNNMIIYGGNGTTTLFQDIWILNLLNFE